MPKGVVVVTGTNGKTTTTKLIAEALTAAGEVVLTNRSGSNLRRGIWSSLIKASSLTGRIDATVALFEVDEASLRRVAAELAPQHVVVLNLFRDQLDRYGELTSTAALLAEGISMTEADLYLNADDPLVASLATARRGAARVTHFGMGDVDVEAATIESVADSDHCPVCGSRLQFSRLFYSHLGHYRCPTGDFERPAPDVVVTRVREATKTGTAFTAEVDGQAHELELPLAGTYNLYNGLAALALASGLGVDVETVRTTLGAARAAFGRVERFEVGDRTVYLLLVKNPAGFAQCLETFVLEDVQAPVLMVINDRHADGRDISWLWDVPLEHLASGRPPVLTSGVRATDMSLRLKYAGVAFDQQPALTPAVRAFLDQVPDGGTGYVLASYTAMLEVRAEFTRFTDVEKVES
nr:Mur ligase family protein [Quadrisphaera sp. RL12-1S]